MTLYEYLNDDEIAVLIRHFGGFDLYIPKKPNDEIGVLPFAKRLCAVFGGETLFIPKSTQANTRAKQNLFVKLVNHDINNGIGKIQAVRNHIKKFGYTQKWGLILLKRGKTVKAVKVKNQLELFENLL